MTAGGGRADPTRAGVFARTFFTALGFLATVVAAFWGAQQINAELVFWLLLPVAVLFALARAYGSDLAEMVTRVRNYHRLLETTAAAQREVRDLHKEVAELRAGLDTRYTEGIAEGEAAVVGAILAANSQAELHLRALSAVADTVILAAEVTAGQVPVAGARFVLEVEVTGERKGVVQVIDYNRERGIVSLRCILPSHAEFWSRLADSALDNPNPPSGLVLRPAPLGESEATATMLSKAIEP